ncbi:MAG: NADH-quinone oxidoreductase subunit NuoH [Desulfobacterota bacterium]|nr:NADH-quinone oxidoreductase subunit NuoH [Thermodesulfobacteriota bacterium]
MDTIISITSAFTSVALAAAVIVGFVFVNATALGYIERKLCGRFQRRIGPMEVGWHGILQMPVDGIKLIAKQLIVPSHVAGPLFYVAPVLAFAPAALPFLVMPFAPRIQVLAMEAGLVFVLAVISFNTFAVFLAGWSSNNNYSMIGALRAVAQNISYEIPILLSLLTVVFLTGSFNLSRIVQVQESLWFVLRHPGAILAFLVFFIAAIAETNRAPFDLPEAESELTAGFHTEYSGIAFGMFMIAEYTYLFVNCCLATAVFFGGWWGPTLPFGQYSSCIWFFIKAYTLVFIVIWCRWTFPRVRFDQLMNLSWKYLIPIALGNLLLTALCTKL